MTVYPTYVYNDMMIKSFLVLQIENHISDIDNWVRSVFNHTILLHWIPYSMYKKTNQITLQQTLSTTSFFWKVYENMPHDL